MKKHSDDRGAVTTAAPYPGSTLDSDGVMNAVAALADEVSSRVFLEAFPNYRHRMLKWCGRAVKNGIYRPAELTMIVERFTRLGLPFCEAVLDRAHTLGPVALKISRSTPASFLKCYSTTNSVRCPVTFDGDDCEPDIVLRGIQGPASDGSSSEATVPLNSFLNSLVEIGATTGYSRLKLLRPELTTHYFEHADYLTAVWRAKNDSEPASYQPTVFQLHETELEHQARLRSLYYTLARKVGLDKEGDYFVLELGGRSQPALRPTMFFIGTKMRAGATTGLAVGSASSPDQTTGARSSQAP